MNIQNVTLSIISGEVALTFAVTVAGQFVFSDNEINAVPQQKFRLSISLYGDDNGNEGEKLYDFRFRGWPSAYAVIRPKQPVQDFSITRIIDGSILDEDPASIKQSPPPGEDWPHPPILSIVARKDEVYARVKLIADAQYTLQVAIAKSNIVIGQFGILGNVVEE